MMTAFDYLLLTLIGAYAVFAAWRCKRHKADCNGNCGACRGCKRTE